MILRSRGRRRGQVLVEVAVSLPFLLFLLLALFDFSTFFHLKLGADACARRGLLWGCRNVPGQAQTLTDGQLEAIRRCALAGEPEGSAKDAIIARLVERDGRRVLDVKVRRSFKPMLPVIWFSGADRKGRVTVEARLTALPREGAAL